MAQFFVNQKCQRRNNQAFDQIKGHRAEKNVGVDAVDQGFTSLQADTIESIGMSLE